MTRPSQGLHPWWQTVSLRVPNSRAKRVVGKGLQIELLATMWLMGCAFQTLVDAIFVLPSPHTIPVQSLCISPSALKALAGSDSGCSFPAPLLSDSGNGIVGVATVGFLSVSSNLERCLFPGPTWPLRGSVATHRGFIAGMIGMSKSWASH